MERERKHNMCARAGTADASIEEGPSGRWFEHAGGGEPPIRKGKTFMIA
jgi:hypothetical protein